MHIALDMDDVVVDFVQGVLDAIELETGTKIWKDSIQDWDMSPLLNKALGEDWWDWLRRRDWLWGKMKAMPGAINGIDRLRRAGHYVELLTTKPDWAEAQVWKWVGRYRPAVNRVTIVPMGEKKFNHSAASILVDDRQENVEEWVAAGRTGVLMLRPWNGRTELPAEGVRAFRVYDWHYLTAWFENEEAGVH